MLWQIGGTRARPTYMRVSGTHPNCVKSAPPAGVGVGALIEPAAHLHLPEPRLSLCLVGLMEKR